MPKAPMTKPAAVTLMLLVAACAPSKDIESPADPPGIEKEDEQQASGSSELEVEAEAEAEADSETSDE